MTGRAALSEQPTYLSIEDGRDAYVAPLRLRQLAKEHGRFWSFHATPTTVALPGNCYAKSLQPFTHHQDEASFRTLLDEFAGLGVARPGGYADVFHERFHSPRVNHSVNAMLAPAFAGGWQDSLKPGWHRGTFYRYDMRSAYLWAATLGLPDTKTYTRSQNGRRVAGRFSGVFRVRLMEPNSSAPFPFNRATECLATTEEIETYSLKIAEILDGVIWKKTLDGDKILEAIRAVSCWKLAARAYWGRWAQMQRVKCVANGKTWYLPNMALNIPWAHVIVSRVKMRLWEMSADAVHVFVDSVITPQKLPVGENLGDWRLEKIYPGGVVVRGPGQYGDIYDEKLEKSSGIPKGSDLRKLA